MSYVLPQIRYRPALGLPPRPSRARSAVRPLSQGSIEFKDRLVYGSDFPLINTLLVSPWYYCWRLSPKQLAAISRTKNPWDADVLTKQNLGTPAGIFERSRQWLGK